MVKSIYYHIILTSLFITSGFLCRAQTRPSAPAFREDSVFITVQVMPEFTPGGPKAFTKFLSDEIKYPQQTDPSYFEKILISFIVEKNGTVSIVHAEGEKNDFKEEVSRVLKKTTWIPGKHYGKTVRVKLVLPIQLHPG